ncbi:MAG: hypothetical protein R2699_06735 [Acidimicrobiales bacterium]
MRESTPSPSCPAASARWTRFELLTLMQTGRAPLAPVVLLEPPGGTYWATREGFVRQELLARGSHRRR